MIKPRSHSARQARADRIGSAARNDDQPGRSDTGSPCHRPLRGSDSMGTMRPHRPGLGPARSAAFAHIAEEVPAVTARDRRPATITRRTFAGATVLALAGGLAACTGGDLSVERTEPPETTVLPGDDLPAASAALSAALFTSSDVAVLADEASLEALLTTLEGFPAPVLAGVDQTVADEIERLGPGTLVVPARVDPGDLGDGREVVEIDLSAEHTDLPKVSAGEATAAVTLLIDPEAASPAQALASAVVTAAGGTVVETPGGDVSRSGESVAAAKEAAGEDASVGVLALGDSFGDASSLIEALGRTATTTELPGGGITAFPGRRMIAAYGSPAVPSLGILGEQDLEQTLERVKEMAAEYDGLAEEPIVPALEIITTIASSEPGGDGDYSSELGVEGLQEWVDAAGETGVYVVLDLQPGTTDFLTQAKLYEELLTAPHVGLALDAEWRLEPGQKHLAQIGSVRATAIDQLSGLLADLMAEHGRPQKVLILHQFTLSRISDRHAVDPSRPQLATTLHADGHGTPEDKLATWNALQQDLPGGIFMAWKNFHDEDTPMFTPKETFALEPRPWFVSYQ